MARRYRRSGRYVRRLKTVKYSNETFNATFASSGTAATANTVLITQIDNQGTRKVKNFELSFSTGTSIYNNSEVSVPNQAPTLWALVYVPQGNMPQNISIGTSTASTLYEPNQNVIMSGILPPGKTTLPIRYKSRLARNLNSGDYIALVTRDATAGLTNPGVRSITASLNYAISF